MIVGHTKRGIVFVLQDPLHHRLFILCWERGSRGVEGVVVDGEITLRRGKKMKFDT